MVIVAVLVQASLKLLLLSLFTTIHVYNVVHCKTVEKKNNNNKIVIK